RVLFRSEGFAFAQQFFGPLVLSWRVRTQERRRFATPSRIDPNRGFSDIANAQRPVPTKRPQRKRPRRFRRGLSKIEFSVPEKRQLWSPPSDEDEPHDGAGAGLGVA